MRVFWCTKNPKRKRGIDNRICRDVYFEEKFSKGELKQNLHRHKERGETALIEAMVYLGAALMAWNVYRYIRFSREVSAKGGMEQETRILNLPILLLVLFLIGYLLVGILGKPDLIVAGILFGGSIFVFVMLVLVQRITEKIQQNEQIRMEMETAKKSNEAKTRFLSQMSHDLRTPLNAIIGYTTLAGRESTSPEEIQENLKKIGTAGQQLLDTINDVLEMSRIESGKMELEPERTCLEELLANTEDLVKPQMDSKQIRFSKEWEKEETWVMCDRAQLSRALMNMLSNACKFTPEGGSVLLAMRQAEKDAESVTCEFVVEDTGIGMSPEFAERLFLPFEREYTSTVSKVQGTGLGMTITKCFVDKMGGTIDVKTKKGEGTKLTMRLRFPTAPAEEEHPTEKAEGRRRDYSGVRLLLAEDNAINQEIAVTLLEYEGFTVDCVGDGQAAVEAIRQAEPGTYAAILMDIQMPAMNGYEATRAIRALEDPERAKIPILALTADAFQEDQKAAQEAGMQGHIAKPIDMEQLLETLEKVL